jgi:L-lactate dehydrogenase
VKMAVNFQKVAIVGCGFVGSSSAFTLMQSGFFNEIVLIDMDRQKAEGEALDISDGVPFVSPQQIYAGDYDDAADAGIIVVTAGAAQKPGETRLDLVHKNVNIFKSIIPEIAKRNFEGIPSHRCESGRYPYVYGGKALRASGKPGDRLGNSA